MNVKGGRGLDVWRSSYSVRAFASKQSTQNSAFHKMRGSSGGGKHVLENKEESKDVAYAAFSVGWV